MVSNQLSVISLMSGRSGAKDYGSLRDVESCFYTNSVVCDINYKDGIIYC